MLETIKSSYAIFWAMGVVAGAGIICKIITTFTLKRLVKAAGKMGKSNQKLMKLVKAKFEHAFMLSDRVDNVAAFVEKYLFEYRVCGLRLHTYRHFSKQCVWILGCLGLVGMFLNYGQAGMEESTFRYGAIGGASMVLMFLVRISSDEEHQLEVVKTYMIDYLENVCAPRYGKQQALKYQRMGNMMQETVVDPVNETVVETSEEVIAEQRIEKAAEQKEETKKPDMREIKIPGQDLPDIQTENVPEAEIQNIEGNREKATRDDEIEKALEKMQEEEQKEEKRVPQEVILREILEEFLA